MGQHVGVDTALPGSERTTVMVRSGGSPWRPATEDEIRLLYTLTMICRNCGGHHHPAARGNRCWCGEIL
jgi:hypothetical protein